MSDGGGPAFPIPIRTTWAPEEDIRRGSGITIRDYFAAAALTGLLANRTYLDCSKAYAWSLPVDDAYSVADYMLAERAK